MLDGNMYVSVMFPEGNVQVFSLTSLFSYCRTNFEGITNVCRFTEAKLKVLTKNGEFTNIIKIEQRKVKSLGWLEIFYGTEDRSFMVFRDSKLLTENRGCIEARDLKASDLLYRYNQDSILMNDSIKVPYKLEAITAIKEVPVKDRVKEPAYIIETETGDFLADNFLMFGAKTEEIQ